MNVFHDSRDIAYRLPFGAVQAGTPVCLKLDVEGALGCLPVLRTWVEGVGEGLLEMGEDPDSAGNGARRFQVTFTPEAAGDVWYQFLVTDREGRVQRYGAQDGRVGGKGQLVDWEPPSFRLHVYEEGADAPAWHAPIDAYLHDDGALRDVAEVAATLSENYPVGACRTSLPWDAPVAQPAPACLPDMMRALDVLEEGAASWFSIGGDVIGLWRACEAGSVICTLMNASTFAVREVFVPLVRDGASELISGYAVETIEATDVPDNAAAVAAFARYARVCLQPLGSLMLHFHDDERLALPMKPGLGVLAHITSLPSAESERPGTLGAQAKAFVDWLSEGGARYWQVLPVNPTDAFGSPYAGISAFAGNTRLLDDSALARLGESSADESAYRAFCEREADWLEPYACFMALRELHGQDVAWWEWPQEHRTYAPQVILENEELAQHAEEERWRQFAFERAWMQLRAYANESGVAIVGDMPIYVSADSADVWAHPELFQLGSDGKPESVAGCAPDAFAEDGQVWGNPLYDWDAHAKSGYAWWLRRLERAFALYDFVRLDHFIGFSRYFSIPSGEKATAGTYRLGPGYDLFKRAYEAFGPLPVIAEDLGLITPRVRALVADCGFPGMDIVQFVDGNDPLSGYAPRPGKIVYTGTHDNQTLRGYVASRYPGAGEEEAFERLMRRAVTCEADVCILPLQDILGLGDEARMNVPGVAEGNWGWQADAAAIEAASERLRELASMRL